MDDVACTKQDKIYVHYILLPIISIATFCLIPPIYSFIYAHYKQQLNSTGLLFNFGVVFYIAIFIDLIAFATYWGFICAQNQTLPTAVHIFLDPQYLYQLQSAVLVTILFNRLVFIFQGTPFSISKCTIIMFITSTIIYITCATIANIIRCDWIAGYLIAIALLIYIIEIIWLNGLLIYKLYKAYKQMGHNISNDPELISMITKTTILTITSTSTIFLLMIAVANNVTPFILLWFIVIDLYSNFFSVLLSYRYYEKWYNKICGCCHNYCNKGCQYCFARKTNEKIQTPTTLNMENVQSNTVTVNTPEIEIRVDVTK